MLGDIRRHWISTKQQPEAKRQQLLSSNPITLSSFFTEARGTEPSLANAAEHRPQKTRWFYRFPWWQRSCWTELCK